MSRRDVQRSAGMKRGPEKEAESEPFRAVLSGRNKRFGLPRENTRFLGNEPQGRELDTTLGKLAKSREHGRPQLE